MSVTGILDYRRRRKCRGEHVSATSHFPDCFRSFSALELQTKLRTIGFRSNGTSHSARPCGLFDIEKPMLDARLEDVPALGQAPINCIHRKCADLAQDHGWHFHPQFELTLFLGSSGFRYIGDSVSRYVPGDLVLSGPNLPHCWRNDDANDSAEWLTIQFDPSYFAALIELPEAFAVRALLAEASGGLAFNEATASEAEAAMRVLVSSQGLQLILKLVEILAFLAGKPRERLATVDYHRNNLVDQTLVRRLEMIAEYIAIHFRGTVSQAELAKSLGMTAAAFSKFVRAAAGTTFSEMVKNTRINQACRLLAYSDETITNVAFECGYQHSSHFNHHFIEQKGMTPTDYRRRMRKLASSETRA